MIQPSPSMNLPVERISFSWPLATAHRKELLTVKNFLLVMSSVYGIGWLVVGSLPFINYGIATRIIVAIGWAAMLLIIDILYSRILSAEFVVDDVGFRDIFGRDYLWEKVRKVWFDPAQPGKQTVHFEMGPTARDITLTFDPDVIDRGDLLRHITRYAPPDCELPSS